MVIFKIPKVIGINYDVKSPATTATFVLFRTIYFPKLLFKALNI